MPTETHSITLIHTDRKWDDALCRCAKFGVVVFKASMLDCKGD